ncbi:putative FK506-binding protein 2 [Neocallimastix lanati (nom. inval.)]|jgi:FKBP-type peptidyl-prolyl cis-trans isomerase|uniref:peptidylprolyl isomerase n=1 Tax=Neocallimastix californiae TaxID=1754190 RepID=A0A1Y2FE84_9FUNG|nr:putative FK506-binding protein 2 [Neocallimastix sp. JGI-2020a]ORY82229.1 putative FK506-binding protein 2 [Neocallimastix californiae]|eukprot:ORY82229.1 putative FK506-binding protein 2 [Neocallimastix californiae]
MNKNFLLLLVLLLLSVTINAKKIKQLQIGVRYRPRECTRKSKKGDTLVVKYKGSLYESKLEFDSTEDRFGETTPFRFVLGADQVIQGWEKGMVDMCVGEKRKLLIPSELGYGENGAGPKIPPHSDLVFEVELLKIEDPKKEDL